MKNAIIIFLILIIIAGAVWYYFNLKPEEVYTPSVPVQKDPIKEKENLIRLDSPKPNEIVKSPLLIDGEARGTWYFEASFPVKLYDANNNLLAQAPAQALSDWMTTDFVSFSVTLTFPTPSTQTGTLVLEKDNPSGLPQNDDSVSIPVSF